MQPTSNESVASLYFEDGSDYDLPVTTHRSDWNFCPMCGAKMLTSKKGNKYCSNICWKKGE